MAVKKAVKKTVKKEVKKTVKKEPKKEILEKDVVIVEEPKKKTEKKSSDKYFYGIGRRKTSIAQVRLYEKNEATEEDLEVNGKEMTKYFPTLAQQNMLTSPLRTAGAFGKFSMTVLVKGGGFTGQVEAIRLGIARALVVFDETLKKSLRDNGHLTRDARKVERKKPGLKKARKAPQWAKR